jgi:hypothetical protein
MRKWPQAHLPMINDAARVDLYPSTGVFAG